MLLNELSEQFAAAVDVIAPSVVQVQGRRNPASGLVYAEGVVITTMRALGREDGLQVRAHDRATFDAELAGWDPSTSLALLRVAGLTAPPAALAATAPRVGHIALAVARSWSNAVTASAGIVSVIGGPLRTGRRRSIAEVIRTTAPMHDGFSGGAFVDGEGRLLGMTTAAAIRGLGVVIPAPIVWTIAATLLEHGGSKRAYLGVVGQAVVLPQTQAVAAGSDNALLIAGVSAGSPAERGGLLIGDLLVAADGRPIATPEDLLDLLTADAVGRRVMLRLLRGGSAVEMPITAGERPAG